MVLSERPKMIFVYDLSNFNDNIFGLTKLFYDYFIFIISFIYFPSLFNILT